MSLYKNFDSESNLPQLTQYLLTHPQILNMGVGEPMETGFKNEGDPIYLIQFRETNSFFESRIEIGRGGLYIALARSGMAGGFGFAIDNYSNATIANDHFLFAELDSESNALFVISIKLENQTTFEKTMLEEGRSVQHLGVVTKNGFVVNGELYDTVSHAKSIFHTLK